jgi:hypothetical protein
VLEKLLQEAQKESAQTSPKLPPFKSPNSADENSQSLIAEILSSPSSLSSNYCHLQANSNNSSQITAKSNESSTTNSLTQSTSFINKKDLLATSKSEQILSKSATSACSCSTSFTKQTNEQIMLKANGNDEMLPNDAGQAEDDDDDVDLEYVDEDEDTLLNNNNSNPNTINDKLINCNDGKCSDCIKHKKQIDLLIEKQIYHEKQLIKLRKEYEEKMLSKSLELTSSTTSHTNHHNSNTDTPKSTSSTSSSFIINTDYNYNYAKYSSYSPPSLNSASTNESKPNNYIYLNNASSGTTNTNINYENSLKTTSTNDWMKYWSSRPQINPPK